MNCNNAQQKILLQSSGELSSAEYDILKEHLGKCKLCREFKQSLEEISLIAHKTMPNKLPSAEIINNIKQQARKKSLRRVLIFRKPFIQWAVAAAIIMIAISNWSLVHNISEENHSDISNMYAILTIMTYPSEIIDNENSTSDLPDMEDLFQEFENNIENEISPTPEILQSLPAKFPQSRNNYGHPQKIYG